MKNNKGITIIALVVTIIVLLILSSISISYVVNKNGIIDNVNKNKENAEIINAHISKLTLYIIRVSP